MNDSTVRNVRSDVSRLIGVFRGQPVDHVPYFEHSIGQRIASHVLGEAVSDNGMTPEQHVRLALRIGMDAVGFGLYWGIGRVSRQASDGTWHYVDGRVKDWNDLAREKRPDLESGLAYLERYLRAAEGTGLGVWVYTHGPWDPVYLGIGYQDFMYKLYDDRRLVETMMDLVLDYHTEVFTRLADYPVCFLMVGDDVAQKTGLMVQPQLFRELWLPRMQRLIAAPKAKGIPLLFHSDGGLDEVLPLVLDLGFDAINPIEPYSNDIYAIKARWGDRITLVGNIDVAGPLSYGTPDEVYADVREHLERLKPGGRYVLCSSHSIVDSVPPANFDAMIAAWREHGVY